MRWVLGWAFWSVERSPTRFGRYGIRGQFVLHQRRDNHRHRFSMQAWMEANTFH